jgi:23S rRNA (cytidine1920-2'-O)/16S rRNA (cytidine1409-2'-O)-methyltransferase
MALPVEEMAAFPPGTTFAAGGSMGSNAKPGMKERVDKLLVGQGLAPSREKAQALILAGLVYLAEVRVEKPGQLLPVDAALSVRGKSCPYVSRGGLKLEAALEAFGPPVSGTVCADVGASTGGFTDCLLQHGAAKVYAVDVGHGQLDAALRGDPRVVCLEGVNARNLAEDFFPEPIQLITVDASFISLKLILPALRRSAPAACLLALVKPQFEAGRREVARGRGVVRDPEVRERALRDVCAAAASLGYTHLGTLESPVRGPKGNVEFFLHLVPTEGLAP